MVLSISIDLIARKEGSFKPCLHGTLPPFCLDQWDRPSPQLIQPLYTMLSILLIATRLPSKRAVPDLFDWDEVVNERESQTGYGVARGGEVEASACLENPRLYRKLPILGPAKVH